MKHNNTLIVIILAASMFIQSLSSCTKEDPWPNTYYGSLLLDGKEMRETKRFTLYSQPRFIYEIISYDENTNSRVFDFRYGLRPYVYEDGAGSFYFSILVLMSQSDFKTEKQYPFTVISENPDKDYYETYRQLSAGNYVEPAVMIRSIQGGGFSSKYFRTHADSGYIVFKNGWNLEGEPKETTCGGIEFGFDYRDEDNIVHHVTDGIAFPKPGQTHYGGDW